MLLDKGANINTSSDTPRRTALLTAIVRGHEDVVCLLLERGADVNAVTEDGQTAVQLARGLKMPRKLQGIIKLLRAHGAPGSSDPDPDDSDSSTDDEADNIPD